MKSTVDIKVWGDYACFTRPEFKVERVSYPVMTPSAARGILEAIYWKPQIRYRIRRIGVLRLGTQWALQRNEISTRQSDRSPFLVADDVRQQRTSLILKDVTYRIQAWIQLSKGETNIGKHLDCLRRRAERGQYFHKPFLGCREFPAEFEWLGIRLNDNQTNNPQQGLCQSIGTMLFDTAYIRNVDHYEKHKEDRLEFWSHDDGVGVVHGYARRLFFNAEIINGWLVEKGGASLPDRLYDELRTLEAGNGIP